MIVDGTTASVRRGVKVICFIKPMHTFSCGILLVTFISKLLHACKLTLSLLNTMAYQMAKTSTYAVFYVFYVQNANFTDELISRRLQGFFTRAWHH